MVLSVSFRCRDFMNALPDFTDAELWVARAAINERYGKAVVLERADSELRRDPKSTALTLCPTRFWNARTTNFVMFKVGDRRYRRQFFHKCARTVRDRPRYP